MVCAVTGNAAESCASQCRVSSVDESLLSAEEPRDVKTKQEYDACYSKCVAQETKEVAEEREKVSKPPVPAIGTTSVLYSIVPCG